MQQLQLKKMFPASAPLKQRVAVIGANGHQAREYMKLMGDHWNIVALVDPNFEPSQYDNSLYQRNVGFLKMQDIDFALVCVPHHMHWEASQFFLERNIPIIKEKPLAVSLDGLQKIKSFEDPAILVTTQRAFSPIFQWAHTMLEKVGVPYRFQYEYTLSVPEETKGWRGRFEYSQGGVVLDMGYHMFDVLIRFFGAPDALYGNLCYCYPSTREAYLEDSATLIYEVYQPHLNLVGTININRHGARKMEELKIFGEKGEMSITPQRAVILDRYGEVLSQSALPLTMDFRVQMLQEYGENLHNQQYLSTHLEHHSKIVSCIDKIYKLNRR